MTVQPLYIYDSLMREKRLFTPQTPGFVGLYVCGPTVSGESHLGHARPFITFDVVYRVLLQAGYKVRYVRNITDAGHFEEEGRAATDKISDKAILERLEPMELTEKYTRLFHQAMQAFGCLPPSIEPRATGHITEQIQMIEDLIDKGYAYVSQGSVYFDTLKYAAQYPYGTLSGRKQEDLLSHTRALSGQEDKRHSADFALWKKAPPQHLMQWKSPWGMGFPGWHIECSAMSVKYLGAQFDIHGGGIDLQFPHHECEIAQSVIANEGSVPARYWMHNNMITINGKKMGKSYGNVITLNELFTGTHPLLLQAYDPISVRFFILQTHYRSTLDFSNEALQAAEKGLHRLLMAYNFVCSTDFLKDEEGQADTQREQWLDELLNAIPIALHDDFNTAKTLACFFDMIPFLNRLQEGAEMISSLTQPLRQRIQDIFQLYLRDLLGLVKEDTADSDTLHSVLDILVELRNEARARKDFKTADRIREQLSAANITLKDGKDGRCAWHFS